MQVLSNKVFNKIILFQTAATVSTHLPACVNYSRERYTNPTVLLLIISKTLTFSCSFIVI